MGRQAERLFINGWQEREEGQWRRPYGAGVVGVLRLESGPLSGIYYRAALLLPERVGGEVLLERHNALGDAMADADRAYRGLEASFNAASRPFYGLTADDLLGFQQMLQLRGVPPGPVAELARAFLRRTDPATPFAAEELLAEALHRAEQSYRERQQLPQEGLI